MAKPLYFLVETGGNRAARFSGGLEPPDLADSRTPYNPLYHPLQHRLTSQPNNSSPVIQNTATESNRGQKINPLGS